jgi:hypothetical protein
VQVGVRQRAAGQEADGEALAGAVVQHGRADARGGRGHRVGVLVLAVDPEQVVRLDAEAHDAGAVGVGDLQVPVGQPARKLLDRAGVARGRRNRVEQALHLGLYHPASVGLASGHRKIVRSPSWPSCRTVPGS